MGAMPFTPTSFTSPDGSETLVAETWSEYYQLLWEGWSPGGPAPTTPPFTVRELDYLNDGYVKIPQDIEPGQTLIWDGLTLQPGDLGSISGDFATLDESGKIAQSAVPDLSAEYAVVDENGQISTAAVPPLPYLAEADLSSKADLVDGELSLDQLPTNQPDPLNRVLDPSFQNYGTWTLPANGSYVDTTAAPFATDDNGKFLRVVASGSTTIDKAEENLFRVYPGQEYILSAWYRRGGGTLPTTGNLRFRFYFYDKDQVAASGAGYYVERVVAAADVTASAWIQTSLRVLVPNGVAFGQAQLIVDRADAGVVYDFDQCNIVPLRRTGGGIDVTSYGVLTSNSAGANDRAMANVLADNPGGKFYFPQIGTYAFSQTWPLTSHTVIQGAGWKTILSWTGQSFMQPNSVLEGITLRDIRMTATSVDLINLNVAGAGMHHITVDHCWLTASGAGSSIVSAISANNIVNLFAWTFTNCKLHRSAASTVPAFRLQTNSIGMNNWHFRSCELHSFNAAGVFFFLNQTSTQNLSFGIRFEDIVGEQNSNGMLNVTGCEGLVCTDVQDWDATVYHESMIRVDASYRSRIHNCGTTSVATFDASQYTVKISGGTGHDVQRTYNGQKGTGTTNIA